MLTSLQPQLVLPPDLIRKGRRAESRNEELQTVWSWEDHLRSIVLDRENGVPLHVQLRASLRRALQSTPPHIEKLPAESLLVDQLRVSQATVRRALDGLVEEGLIVRKRALGTTITRGPLEGAALKHIAMIAPNFPSYAQGGHLAALGAGASAQGATLSLITLNSGDDWHACKRQLSFGPADGGIVLLGNPMQTTVDIYQHLASEGYRTVHIGPPLANCMCNSVGISNEAYIRVGLQKLMAMGHRRILFLVGEPEEVPESVERVGLFEKIARQMGLEIPYETEVLHCGIHQWESSSEATSHAITRLWQSRDQGSRPTAIFGISDSVAAGALFGLTRIGVEVPREVSILSYDGTELTRIVQPTLTTLVTPMAAFSAAVLDLLNSGASNRQVFIEPDFRDGKSLSAMSFD